jgi:hypothetical protein
VVIPRKKKKKKKNQKIKNQKSKEAKLPIHWPIVGSLLGSVVLFKTQVISAQSWLSLQPNLGFLFFIRL